MINQVLPRSLNESQNENDTCTIGIWSRQYPDNIMNWNDTGWNGEGGGGGIH